MKEGNRIKSNPLDKKKHITPDVALFNKMTDMVIKKETLKETEKSKIC